LLLLAACDAGLPVAWRFLFEQVGRALERIGYPLDFVKLKARPSTRSELSPVISKERADIDEAPVPVLAHLDADLIAVPAGNGRNDVARIHDRAP
jgi:hypothetical protein